MANPDSLKPFEKGDDPRRNTEGRPVGSKNRATIAKKWLSLELEEVNPLTGEKEKLTLEDIITLRQLNEAKGKVRGVYAGAAYKNLMDSAYGAPKQETDTTVTLTNFKVKDVIDFDDNPEPEV